MDDRITRTMAACERVSSQVTNLESQMSRVFEKLDQIVNRLPPSPPQQQITIPASEADGSNSQKTPSISSRSKESDFATHQSNTSSTIRSPEKKKQKHKGRSEHLTQEDVTMQNSDSDNSTTDQSGFQYTEPSPADGGEHE